MPWADLNYNHVCAGNEASLQYFPLCHKAMRDRIKNGCNV